MLKILSLIILFVLSIWPAISASTTFIKDNPKTEKDKEQENKEILPPKPELEEEKKQKPPDTDNRMPHCHIHPWERNDCQYPRLSVHHLHFA